MSDSPMISVIIPAYNVEKFLDRCLRSVIEQTFAPLEIILIDDGSTDDTPRLCDEWGQRDERIRVVHQSNVGLAETRNRGVALATAPFVGFVDSDDWIEPDMYQRLYDAHLKYDADLVVCNFYMDFVEEGTTELMHDKPSGLYPKAEALFRLMIEKGLDCYSWNKLYRRSLFDGVVYPRGRWMEDHSTTYKLYFNAKRIAYIEIPLYHYIRHNESFTMSSSVLREADYFQAIVERRAFFLEHPFFSPREMALFRIKGAQRTISSIKVLDEITEPDEALDLKAEMTAFVRDTFSVCRRPSFWKRRTRLAINLNKLYAYLRYWS